MHEGRRACLRAHLVLFDRQLFAPFLSERDVDGVVAVASFAVVLLWNGLLRQSDAGTVLPDLTAFTESRGSSSSSSSINDSSVNGGSVMSYSSTTEAARASTY